jgi:hypothetical protein
MSITAADNVQSKDRASVNYSIQIVDGSGGRDLAGTSLETLQESPFKSFVTIISEHIRARAAAAPLLENSKDEAEITASFVYWPLVAHGANSASTPPALDTDQTPGAAHLLSPWSHLAISKTPRLSVKAIFVWSERQFLVDQAFMAGARPESSLRVARIEDKVFEKYVQDYADSVLLAASPEARAEAQAHMPERIPAELLWLFRQAWQSTFAPFSNGVRHALGTVIERAAPGYTSLVETLVDRGFAAPGSEQRYDNVLDLGDVPALGAYKIERLH